MSQQRRLTGPKKYAAVLLAVVFILLIWQAAAWSLPDFLMPGIPSVLERMQSALQEPAFREGLLGSMSRLGSGYSFALLFGIGFGLVGGVLFFFREILRSAIVILQSIPSIAWVPLFLIVMGFGNLPIIVVVALAAFFPMALSVMNATESVQPVHVSAARVMGASRWQLLRRVYLPAVMPELITGAQLAFGNAWRALISAEMLIGFGQGLGRALAYSGEIADMTGVMMNILVIAILATLIDQVVLEKFKQRMLRYQYV
ncbi:ABC transporter permease [Pseudomonadota bacterium DY0742]|uniref:ABC transporter permease n=1 Tax=Stutzerimonas balearica TaxID=74829 RepID=UPI001BC9A081|nr:ABC transporter permease [Stutzerimonas balearica]MBS4150686.1 ABC transporter permease [Stutzerimonas balearica]